MTQPTPLALTVPTHLVPGDALMPQRPQPRIKIFWDIESCPPPASYLGSPWDLLKAIRLFITRFGIVTSIKAYWDGIDAPDSEAITGPLRVAMPSMGISLVDCSLVKEYSRDALPRTLSVDVLVSAIDDPISLDTPGNDAVVILSGNKSILHPISLLMFRGYTIYLVVPDETNIEQSRANKVFKWHADVLGLNSDSSPEPTTVSSTECSTPEGLSLNRPRASRNLRDHLAGSLPMSPQQPSSSPPTPHPPTSSDEVSYSTSPPQPPRKFTPLSPRKVPVNTPSFHPMSPSMFASATTPATTPKTKSRDIPAFESSGSRAPSASPFNPKTNALDKVQGTCASSSKSPDGRAQMFAQMLGSPSPAQEEMHRDVDNDWRASSGWNENGGWEMSASSWLTGPEPSAIGPSQEASPPLQPRPWPGSRAPWTAEPRVGHAPGVNQPMPGCQPETSAADVSVFIPLLQTLQKARADGKNEVLRSVIGAVMAKDKTIYEVAGVTTFNGYITLAAQKGLVVLGGVGGKAWVGLR